MVAGTVRSDNGSTEGGESTEIVIGETEASVEGEVVIFREKDKGVVTEGCAVVRRAFGADWTRGDRTTCRRMDSLFNCNVTPRIGADILVEGMAGVWTLERRCRGAGAEVYSEKKFALAPTTTLARGITEQRSTPPDSLQSIHQWRQSRRYARLARVCAAYGSQQTALSPSMALRSASFPRLRSRVKSYRRRMRLRILPLRPLLQQ